MGDVRAFGLLFVNLNVVQVLNAGELAQDDRNRRVLLREYAVERGSIVLGDDRQTEIARSFDTGGTCATSGSTRGGHLGARDRVPLADLRPRPAGAQLQHVPLGRRPRRAR